MVLHWSLMNLVVTCLVLADDASLGDIGVHSRGDGLRVRFLRVADDETVSWRERRALANEFLSLSERFSVRRYLSNTVHDTLLELTEDQGDQDGQEGEHVLGWPHLCTPSLIVVSMCGKEGRGFGLSR